MKKILLILMLGLFALTSFSQNLSLGYSKTFFEYNGKASDTIGIADSVWTYEFKKLSTNRVYPYVYMSLDAVSGTPASVTILLQSKVTSDEGWTNRDTVTYSGTADTTFSLSPTEVPYIADYHRVIMTGSTDEFKVKVNLLNGKIVY